MLGLEEAPVPLDEGMPPVPSVEDFACILSKCRNERNRSHALRLHACMHKTGLDAHAILGNQLVSLLVEVGSMNDAHQVFDWLVYRNECSWNALITGYINCGASKHALTLYQKMQEDDALHPRLYTFVALLKVCADLKDLKRGSHIHAQISRQGLLERDIFVGTTLVDMYAKCGSLAKAQEVFDKLPVRNAISWTALIAGYTEQTGGQEALHYFEEMQLEGVYPDDVTFVCSLKACGNIGDTDKGQEMHVDITKKGLERNLIVGSTLVDMYSKCGSLANAQEVFDKLPIQDVVSWTALIAGYVEQGYGEKAIDCFKQMRHKDVSPDAVTFVCSLKACSSIGATDKGRVIHSEIAAKGMETHILAGNTLVDMYAKFGLLAEAQKAFDNLPVQTIVSWNALIAGYAEQGLGEEALDCFKQMQHCGTSPDAVTFACSLKACARIGATDKVQVIHSEIASKGMEKDLVVGNTLVDLYAKCGSLPKAQEVFDKLPVQDKVSWTALIAGYAEHGFGEVALNCFEQMQQEGISPDAVTFACSLKACGCIGAANKGQKIHGEITRKGLETDSLVGNTLIDMYAKCGSLAEAQEVLDKVTGQNVVSWNTLVAGCAEQGRGEEALNCCDWMRLKGISPDVVTYLCSLKACGSVGSTDKGQEMHAEITGKGLEGDLSVGNMLVDLYAKCGWFAEAQEVFDKLLDRDEISWNVLITGYAQLGEIEKVFHILERMIGEGLKPNRITFLSVLSACSHAGLVDKGEMYFDAMSKDYGIIPTLEHHTCMVDLLGRSGHVDKAIAMIKNMPFHPSFVMWHSMLGSCRKWGNVELGRQAFECAVQLDEKDTVAYVCMSNIYADADMQEAANKVEAIRLEKHAWKSQDIVGGLMPLEWCIPLG